MPTTTRSPATSQQRRLFAIAISLAGSLAAPAAAQVAGKTIFWAGNSHTRWYGGGSVGPQSVEPGIAQVVRELAVEAGFAAPTNIWSVETPTGTSYSVVDGSFLFQRATGAQQFVQAVPPGGWDHIVLQGNSVENVPALGGNPRRFDQAIDFFDATFRAHSPGLETILYQTWARGAGHANYAAQGGPVTDPQAYHDATRAGYQNAADRLRAINADPGSVRVAAVGDAWALANWDLSLYIADQNHSSDKGSLLAALILYGTIYEDRTVTDLAVDFQSGTSDLEIRLRSSQIDAATWSEITTLAEAVLVPAPGSTLLLPGLLIMAARRRRQTHHSSETRNS